MNVSLRRSLKTHRKSKDSSIRCYESNFLFMKKKFNVSRVITENWINKNVAALANIAKYKIIKKSYFVIDLKFAFIISPKEKTNEMNSAATIMPNVKISGGSL